MDIRFAFDPDQSATFGSRLRFHFVSYISSFIYNVATEIPDNIGCKQTMKRLLGVFIGLTLVMLSTGSQAGELALSHTDPAWKDGKGKVPDIGICEARNVGGKGMSPSIEVTGIPSGTVKLELHFTDEDWHAGEGAHGVVGLSLIHISEPTRPY